ncbi:MAG: hypothetical protein HZB71_03945 [Betaproteobacteria bacterium]|nr:hypothetical protein [Betaproteobacteria bacterium]
MKELTPDNWLEPDTAQTVLDARAWRDDFLAVRLDAAVPRELADMFEAARGAMIYGYFFQPLVTLGVEHCYRALEAAARARCTLLGLPVSCADSQGKEHPLSFSHNLRALGARSLISEEDTKLWYQARELRNWAASPDRQTLLTPDHGATALSRTAELLGKLFRDSPE